MDLVDDVCSPGGTTVAGLLAMEEYGFTTSVIKGLDATVAKDKNNSRLLDFLVYTNYD